MTWGIRWVDTAAMHPHHCAVFPQVGNSNAAGGFIDTGIDYADGYERIYVSAVAVEEMARMIGWSPGQPVEREDTRVAELEAKVRDLEHQLDAVFTLRRAGFTSSRRPGRPLKEKT